MVHPLPHAHAGLGLDAKRGPHDPLPATPPRPSGSIRRTSTVDTTWDGEPGATRTIDGRARDLLTPTGGDAVVLGEARLLAHATGDRRTLVDVTCEPSSPALAELLGRPVGQGFRAAVDAALPEEADTLSLRYLLLDDLPGASLVAGHAQMAAFGPRPTDPEHQGDGILRDDLCAGWAVDATMMVTIRATGIHPPATGPVAPDLMAIDDPLAWHEVAPMPPHGMRRLRRLDLVAPTERGGAHRLDVHFRDSHMDADGVETVVHEYGLHGTVDGHGVVTELVARAHVLPWMECPQAAASAGRLAGRSVHGLRPLVRQTFVGTTTCTHLNDTLRGLADVERLLALLTTTTS